MAPHHWTQDERQLIKQMLIDGASMREMSQRLRMSRNAVSGIVFRDPELRTMDRPHHHTPGVKMAKASSVPRAPKPQPAAVSPPRPAAAVPSVPVRGRPPSPLPARAPTPKLLALADIGSNACRFPIDEDASTIGSHRFCAADTGGPVYCPYHQRVAWTSSYERTKRTSLTSWGGR